MARAQAGSAVAVVQPAGVRAEVTALKRERILDAATALFLRAGYHGTSMDAIARSIGATKPFIYYQFRDKSDILAAICAEGAALALSALDEAEARPAPIEARMHWFCRRLAEIVVNRGDYLAVYLRETANLAEADRAAILRMRATIDRRLTRLVQAGMRSGEFRTAHAGVAARAITGMIANSFHWYHARGMPTGEAFATLLADIAMRTLRAA